MVTKKRSGIEKPPTQQQWKFDCCVQVLDNLILAIEHHDPTEIEQNADTARQFLDKLRDEE